MNIGGGLVQELGYGTQGHEGILALPWVLATISEELNHLDFILLGVFDLHLLSGWFNYYNLLASLSYL